MNSLETRKQLLIAESDLNRAGLLEEMAALAAGVRMATNRAKSFGSVASVAAVVVVGLVALRRGQPGIATAKFSRLQSILKVAGLLSSSWLAFRSQRRGPKDN